MFLCCGTCYTLLIVSKLASLPCWLSTLLLFVLLLLSYYVELHYEGFVDAYSLVTGKPRSVELNRALFSRYSCCCLLFKLKRATAVAAFVAVVIVEAQASNCRCCVLLELSFVITVLIGVAYWRLLFVT